MSLATNPQEAIKGARQLVFSKKSLKENENIDDSTEVLKVKANSVSKDLLEYLRSALMTKNYTKEDASRIMVSAPRVLGFELLVVRYAIDLLEEYSINEEN